MRAPQIRYSVEELAWLGENYMLVAGELHKAFCERFGRQDVTVIKIKSLRKSKGYRTGRKGYERGNTPLNKGSAAIGEERVREGYRQRRVFDEATGLTLWRVAHRIEWEAVNGPVPPGMRLKCKGDRGDISPLNWVVMPTEMANRLACGSYSMRYDSAPEEVRPALLALAQLDHAVREKRKGGEAKADHGEVHDRE